jgi:hypothetical protein
LYDADAPLYCRMPRRQRPGPVEVLDLEAELDRLFQQAPEAFVASRNALVGRLKKAGRENAVEEVRTLAKPPLAAWAINQVYWRARDVYDGLVDAGDRLRRAQRRVLAGSEADMREAMSVRQTAVKRAADAALQQLRAAGQKATGATRQRVEVSLDAVAAAGRGPDAPAAGRLTHDLAPPGLDLLSSLAGSLSRPGKDPRPPAPARAHAAREPRAAPTTREPSTRPGADREAGRQARRAELEARTAVARAESEATRLRRVRTRRAEAVKRAERRAREAQRDAERARQARDRAEQALARAHRAWERTERSRAEAEADLATATEAREDAARPLEASEAALSSARDALRRLQ